MKLKNIIKQNYKIDRKKRENQYHQHGKVIWFTGLSGSGKSTLANLLEYELHQKGFKTYVLDGDNLRFGLNQDLNFSPQDRKENLRRTAEVAKLFVDAGVVVLAAFITPYQEDRDKIKQIIGKEDFMHIFVEAPLEICEKRDVKGLYAKARAGEIKDFTGINAPFEIPKTYDLIIHTEKEKPEESVDKLLSLVLHKINLQK